MTTILNDDLIAKCSPRGWGDVVWTSFFPRGVVHVEGRTPAPERWSNRQAMAYMMEHWASTGRYRRYIDEIIVTNLYCGVANGWDIIIWGTIMGHEDRKSEAQALAEKLLDGMR